jgi:hypothetical protein
MYLEEGNKYTSKFNKNIAYYNYLLKYLVKLSCHLLWNDTSVGLVNL